MARLSARSFNRHLNHMGQAFNWRKGYACPCVSRESGQPDPQCNHCDGKGRQWPDAPVPGTAGVISQAKLKRYEVFGPFDQDDMLLSIGSDSALYAIGQYDRVDALNRTEPFSMALIRGLNDIIRFPVVSVDRAFYINQVDAITELPVPLVNADGTLDWQGSPPPAQFSFSLTGRRRPQYYCYLDLPVDRPQHHGEKLPRRVILRRFELLDRSR